MLDDLLLTDSGIVPFGGEATTHALMGRFGDVLLVNGEPGYQLDVRRGKTIRLAQARTMLSFDIYNVLNANAVLTENTVTVWLRRADGTKGTQIGSDAPDAAGAWSIRVRNVPASERVGAQPIAAPIESVSGLR